MTRAIPENDYGLELNGRTNMQVFIVPVTQFQQNCSVLICEYKTSCLRRPRWRHRTPRAVTHRAGCNTRENIADTCTHRPCRCDSSGSRSAWRTYRRPTPRRSFLIDQLPEQSARFGFPPSRTFEPARWLDQGDTVTVGEETLSVHHCPGHTPGHVVFSRWPQPRDRGRRPVPGFDRPNRLATRELSNAD